MELNPNHPATAGMRDQWHKIAAILMHKIGATHVVITEDDIRAFACAGQPGACIAVQEKSDGLHLRLISAEEGARLARRSGGLPV